MIVKRWISSPTIAPNAGTRWAAYNAVTEYVDHYSKVRGGDDQSHITVDTPVPYRLADLLMPVADSGPRICNACAAWMRS